MEPTDLVPLNPVTGEPLPEGELHQADDGGEDTAEHLGPDAED